MIRVLAAIVFGVVLAAQAFGQGAVDPRREALDRLAKRVNVDLNEARLEDVVQFLATIGSLEFDPAWEDESGREGLDKDAMVSIRASNLPILSILERILAKTGTGFGGNAWQLTPEGLVEIGPKSRLNESATLKVYDIQDLLFEVRNYTSVPELDLDAAVQQSQGGGGGGGGQSIFEDDEEEAEDQPTQEERARELIALIIETIEPDEWADNGGDGGTIRFYRGTLLVRAPDYMHRQLGGYSFWPRSVPMRTADRAKDWRETSGNTVVVAPDPDAAPVADAPAVPAEAAPAEATPAPAPN
jgi:hypothetical protein